MKKLIIILPVVFVLVWALAACATPPTEEMNKAQDAVTRAENDADAVTYAGNTVAAARNSLSQMQDAADAKRYDSAKSFAQEAVSNAEKAIADGQAGAARAKDEASNLVNGLATPLAETSDTLDAAKKVQNTQLDYNTLDGEMDSARQTYAGAKQDLAADNYQNAETKGQDVRSQLSDINEKLNSAVQAASRKK